ncbi:hypothetical protein E4U52_003321 [Claviceps spartinae]|nr:hypothetical protein E4U52_003321 [Claviceps spartinae]
MADLIEEERRIVLDNPLGHSLGSVREALRNAEGDAQGEAFDAERSDPWLEAVSELVIALLASRACRRLTSRIENRRHLASNLVDIRTRLEKHELPIQVVRPLSQLVLNQASDIEIWTAVIVVVATLNKDTPSTYQPLSWSPFEDTATKADAEVFDEIFNSTHCAVGGFHQKYFEGHEWSMEQASRRNDLLATEQAAYFGRPVQYEDGSDSEDDDSDSEHCGPVCSHSQELELLVKKKKNGSAVEQHDWRYVLAIDRLAQSEQTEAKELLLRLDNAVREVFSQQPTRLFVHAFTLTSDWYNYGDMGIRSIWALQRRHVQRPRGAREVCAGALRVIDDG